MQNFIIDPEFRDKIPPLTEEEFSLLEENIITDGEVQKPIVVWNNTIIDGHHRWKVIQRHPEIPYTVKRMEFADKWAAIEWMCKNQLGQRNLNEPQRKVLMAQQYEARRKTIGAPAGNQNASEKQFLQNEGIESKNRGTAGEIAKQNGVSTVYVERSVRFSRGLDEAEKVSPGFKDAILEGKIKAPESKIAEIRRLPDEEKKEVVEAIKRGDYKPEKKKRAENQGYSKALRETYENIDSAVTAMYDTDSEVTYTTDDLKEELQSIVQDFIKKAKRTLTIRSTVLNEPGAREKISAVLLEAETAVKEMKGLVL